MQPPETNDLQLQGDVYDVSDISTTSILVKSENYMRHHRFTRENVENYPPLRGKHLAQNTRELLATALKFT